MYLRDMSKVVIFLAICPQIFLTTFFFLETPKFLGCSKFFYISLNRHPPNFFALPKFSRLTNHFLAPTKPFFRPKKFLLDFLDLKISLNPLKTLRKHLFSLQIDEKNIFLAFTAKNCPNY